MTLELFISGTDTDVGKTQVSCAIIKRLRTVSERVAAFKPVCTGVTPDDRTDLDRLAAAIGCTPDEIAGETFREPLSPPSAAKLEQREVDIERIDTALRTLQAASPDYLLIEGAGGLRCPITEETTILDLVRRWKTPVLVVAGIKLGAINHTLMTHEIATHYGLRPKVVLCEPRPVEPSVRESTVRELAARLKSDIVGVMPFGGDLLNFDHQKPTIWEAGSPIALDVVQSLFGQSTAIGRMPADN